ncbi:MAG: tRNA glutamyl-Q(34) synthetase GluQRS [Clostridiales bacterium]|nr:tRNA glutamyl-Q(34) synthetase GluQRS [Clostridiales bacterium]
MSCTGRFAPSPSGFLHPGNLLCALLAWLSCRAQGGRFLVRIEDLDVLRCPKKLSDACLADLAFLGLVSDEPPLWQSERTARYRQQADRLSQMGLTYPCFCTRRDLHAAFAPNRGDVNPVYSGRCRGLSREEAEALALLRRPALRLKVPEETIAFTDGHMGEFSEYLPRDCGDFIIRRSDGLYAYQLAVVTDDAESGVTEVVRGADILSSTPRQILLQRLLGFETPRYFHIPLLTDGNGRRLAKRDADVSLPVLARRYPKAKILGFLGFAAGLLQEPRETTLDELLYLFSWDKVPKTDIRLSPEMLSA